MMIIVMVAVGGVMVLATVINEKKKLGVLTMMAMETMRRDINPEAGLFARKLKT